MLCLAALYAAWTDAVHGLLSTSSGRGRNVRDQYRVNQTLV